MRGECPPTYQEDGYVRINMKKRSRQCAPIHRFVISRAPDFTRTLKTKDLSASPPAKPSQALVLVPMEAYSGKALSAGKAKSFCPEGTLSRIPRISRTIFVGVRLQT